MARRYRKKEAKKDNQDAKESQEISQQEASQPTKNNQQAQDWKVIVSVEQPELVRVALVSPEGLEAFQISSLSSRQSRGNIYKGRITNIEPSLQAVFVEIGPGKNAYLPIHDVHPEYYEYREKRDEINRSLTKGQDVLVQVVKEETPLKGPAVSTYLSIPGRYLVLMPGASQSGVSRKIEDEKERDRLKSIISECKRPEGVGLIARTASIGIPKTELKKDLTYLLRLWESIKKKVRTTPAPTILFQDREIATRFIRDYLSPKVTNIYVDNEAMFNSITAFLKLISPRHINILKLYSEPTPIFQAFGLENRIASIFESKVALPSGGYLIIEPTEALVSIDVNSGKNIKEKDLDDTALATNMEAACEVARQLRLRDLGGIIVVDFIDMRNRSYRQKLERHFRDCLKVDKAKVDVSRVSEFGLIEVVRQKLNAPVHTIAFSPCPHCNGSGRIKNLEIATLDCLRAIKSALASDITQAKKTEEPCSLIVNSHHELANHLLNNKRMELVEIEKQHGTHIVINPTHNMQPSIFTVEYSTDKPRNGETTCQKKTKDA